MPDPTDPNSDPGDHRFNPQTAAPALKAAIIDLAERTERSESEFVGMTLGELYDIATAAYDDDLPEYWRVWQSWQSSSFDPPADMGDL